MKIKIRRGRGRENDKTYRRANYREATYPRRMVMV